jgi:hypothetical protein
MRIRDLKWRDVPMWPPEWWVTDQGSGEEGHLEVVHFRNDKKPACISVGAVHSGAERKGIIILEESAQLEVLYRKLQENLGRPLTEIGDLEIDFSPALPKKGFRRVRPHPPLLPKSVVK